MSWFTGEGATPSFTDCRAASMKFANAALTAAVSN